MKRSNYNVIADTETYILLQDVGPWDKYKTITNDIDDVLSDLKTILNNRELRYIDSDGDVSIVEYSETYKFVKFK